MINFGTIVLFKSQTGYSKLKAESLDETAIWRLKMAYHSGKKKKGKKKKKGLTPKQKKLPMALQKAILKKMRGKK